MRGPPAPVTHVPDAGCASPADKDKDRDKGGDRHVNGGRGRHAGGARNADAGGADSLRGSWNNDR
ncbi:hypothetical protein GCM10010518_24270 [Kitasatospora cinereorecta]